MYHTSSALVPSSGWPPCAGAVSGKKERVGGPGARARVGFFPRGMGGKRPSVAPRPANAPLASGDAPQSETLPSDVPSSPPRAATGPVWPSAQLAGVTAQGSMERSGPGSRVGLPTPTHTAPACTRRSADQPLREHALAASGLRQAIAIRRNGRSRSAEIRKKPLERFGAHPLTSLSHRTRGHDRAPIPTRQGQIQPLDHFRDRSIPQ